MFLKPEGLLVYIKLSLCFSSFDITSYYIVILRWPVGSRMLHQNTTVIRRVTTARTDEGCDLRFVRAMSPKLGQ